MVSTGGSVISEDPVGGWPQINEVFFEEKWSRNRPIQDLAFLVVRDDITL